MTFLPAGLAAWALYDVYHFNPFLAILIALPGLAWMLIGGAAKPAGKNVMRRKINIGAAIYPSQSQPVMSDTAMPAMQYIASAYTRYTTATKLGYIAAPIFIFLRMTFLPAGLAAWALYDVYHFNPVDENLFKCIHLLKEKM